MNEMLFLPDMARLEFVRGPAKDLRYSIIAVRYSIVDSIVDEDNVRTGCGDTFEFAIADLFIIVVMHPVGNTRTIRMHGHR
jgi:hypothetical protein